MGLPPGVPYKWTMTSEELSICTRAMLGAAKSFPDGLFVEVGTYDGYSSEQFCRLLEEVGTNPRFIGVDCDPGVVDKWWKRIKAIPLNLNGTRKTSVRFICKDTQKACAAVDQDIHWLLVDACHCFECALWDIENWGNKVAVGGYLLAHDTRMTHHRAVKLSQHDRRRPFGVKRAVETSQLLKDRFQLVEQCESESGAMSFIRVR